MANICADDVTWPWRDTKARRVNGWWRSWSVGASGMTGDVIYVDAGLHIVA
jgi:hypothetical protein